MPKRYRYDYEESGLTPAKRRRNAAALEALAGRDKKKAARKLAAIAKRSATPRRGPEAAPVLQMVRSLDPPAYVAGMRDAFYLTREWRNLRWRILIASDGKCGMCGRSRRDGVILHVDHIKPRSRFPKLELVASNLQVLCAECNIGKGAATYKC